MKTKMYKVINHSLLVEENDLQSLLNFISSKYKSISIIAKCVDGSVLETEDITDIISFENPNFRRITSISISAGNDIEVILSINFHSYSLSDSAEISIVSRDDTHAVYMIKELANRMNEMKAPYDIVTRRTFLFLVIVPIVILSFGAFFSITRYPRYIILPIYTPQIISESLSFLTFILLIFSIPIPSIALFIGIIKLFPKLFFLIGRQKKTMETLKNRRRFLFSGLLLTVVLGILVNFISARLLDQ